jgi:hypothetical protein
VCGFGIIGRGEVTGKRGRRVNTMQKCVHMYVNATMIPVEYIPEMGKGVGQRSAWRGVIKV